jgi:hypothetical protein
MKFVPKYLLPQLATPIRIKKKSKNCLKIVKKKVLKKLSTNCEKVVKKMSKVVKVVKKLSKFLSQLIKAKTK